MDFQFDFEGNEAFARVRRSYYELCAAEARLKKARRRAQAVRTIEKALVVVGVVVIYNKIKSDFASE